MPSPARSHTATVPRPRGSPAACTTVNRRATAPGRSSTQCTGAGPPAVVVASSTRSPITASPSRTHTAAPAGTTVGFSAVPA